LKWFESGRAFEQAIRRRVQRGKNDQSSAEMTEFLGARCLIVRPVLYFKTIMA
jgi:hypothetical protein